MHISNSYQPTSELIYRTVNILVTGYFSAVGIIRTFGERKTGVKQHFLAYAYVWRKRKYTQFTSKKFYSSRKNKQKKKIEILEIF